MTGIGQFLSPRLRATVEAGRWRLVTGQTTQGAESTSDVPVELLVVLGPGTQGLASARWPPPTRQQGGRVGATPPLGPPPLTAIEALSEIVPVAQAFPPRLALVDLSITAAVVVEILDQPYTVGVYDAAPPRDVLATLDEGEQLFVAAWLARVELARHGGVARPGEGLPWDAPGYKPPDAPGPAAA
jgi:hypothetical protein